MDGTGPSWCWASGCLRWPRWWPGGGSSNSALIGRNTRCPAPALSREEISVARRQHPVELGDKPLDRGSQRDRQRLRACFGGGHQREVRGAVSGIVFAQHFFAGFAD